VTDDQRHGRRRRDRSRVIRLVEILVSALAVGAGFGAATALVNAISHGYADLESRAYTTSGWSGAEIMSVLLDSGWAWAGLAVAVGWPSGRIGTDFGGRTGRADVSAARVPRTLKEASM
jgi:hypothetical protein